MTGENEENPDYIPLRRLNLNLLYALDAILSARSLTEAGKRVLLSQPAMSLSLRKLRDQFSDELVVYISGERVLTPLATAIQPRVRRLLKELDSTFHFQLEFDAATTQRSIRIAAPEALEIMLLGRVIPQLLAEAPNIDVQVIPFDHNSPGRAFENGADMIIVPERFTDSRFPSQPLMNDRFACMIWNEHPSINDTLSSETFLKSRHVSVFDPMISRAHMDENIRELLDQRNIVVRTSLHAALPGLILGTDLIATSSCWILQHWASMMPLRVLPFPSKTPEDPIVAQWPAYLNDDPAHRWLLQHMVRMTSLIG